MRPLLSRESSRALDADAVARLGMSSLLLMENAGRGAFAAIRRAIPERLGRVVLVGGRGQNGGDAWVLARHLVVAGYAPRAFLLGDRGKVGGDAAPNLDTLERLGVPVLALAGDDLAPLEAALEGATLIVDGLFGTGLDRPIVGRYAAALEQMDAAAAKVVALDLPSGLDANTGEVLGASVHAALTVTFAGVKRGLTQFPGRAYAGHVEVAHIGVPLPASGSAFLLDASDVAGWLPRRPEDAHKGTAGHVLLFTGGAGTLGAALLSGRATLRAGAGLATVAARPDVLAALEARIPELMSLELPHEPSPSRLAPAYEGKRAAVLGPGLGKSTWAERLTLSVALEAPLPVVIDADGLNALAREGAVDLSSAKGPRVLTPHPKEASRLLGATVDEVQADRFAAAVELARRSGQVVVLKGAGTIIADPGGAIAVCDRGTPALGVGGTGDVLAGAVGALLAALPPFEAASAAVYLHALAGELAARSDRGLFASDLADALPLALERVREP
jgi:NAD(P)H-hydrate epimerase